VASYILVKVTQISYTIQNVIYEGSIWAGQSFRFLSLELAAAIVCDNSLL
jgi:hypothetical protein